MGGANSTTTMRRAAVRTSVFSQQPGTAELYAESKNDATCTMDATSSTVQGAMPPEIDSITPDNGDTGGGTNVTVKGRGFTSVIAMFIDVNACEFTIVDDETITTVVPADSRNAVSCPVIAGQVDVKLSSPAGDGFLPGGFTYTSGG